MVKGNYMLMMLVNDEAYVQLQADRAYSLHLYNVVVIQFWWWIERFIADLVIELAMLSIEMLYIQILRAMTELDYRGYFMSFYYCIYYFYIDCKDPNGFAHFYCT